MFPEPNCRKLVYSLPQKPQITPNNKSKTVGSDAGCLSNPNFHRSVSSPASNEQQTQIQTSAEVSRIYLQADCSVVGFSTILPRLNSLQTNPHYERISQSTEKSGSRLRTKSLSRRTKAVLKHPKREIKLALECKTPRSNSCLNQVKRLAKKGTRSADRSHFQSIELCEVKSDTKVPRSHVDINTSALQAEQAPRVDSRSQMLIEPITQLNAHTWALIPIVDELVDSKSNLRTLEHNPVLPNPEADLSSPSVVDAANSIKHNLSHIVDVADLVPGLCDDHAVAPQTPTFSKRSSFSFGSISEHEQPDFSEHK